MKIVETILGDVLIISPTKTDDDSNCVFSVNEFAAQGKFHNFVQDNHSSSNYGVIRGLHYQIQHPQAKLVYVPDGCITDVVVDLRKSSANFGKYSKIELSRDNGLIVFIPEGFAHGFIVTSTQATVLYKVTDYRYPEYERTLLWNDPELAIPWPVDVEKLVISSRDRSGTPFRYSDHFV